MEFQDVVRRRRMVRRFTAEPVAPETVERLVRNAVRAPNAGFAQGWSFLVLTEPGDVARFWAATTPADPERSMSAWLAGMRTAPVLVVALTSKDAYLARYAEDDKGWADQDESRWPMPFWHMDTAMASLLILQTAVDAGLGALFFGIPVERVAEVRRELVIPDTHDPIGALTIGHLTEDAGLPGSARTRRRIPLDDVVHRGGWGR